MCSVGEVPVQYNSNVPFSRQQRHLLSSAAVIVSQLELTAWSRQELANNQGVSVLGSTHESSATILILHTCIYTYRYTHTHNTCDFIKFTLEMNSYSMTKIDICFSTPNKEDLNDFKSCPNNFITDISGMRRKLRISMLIPLIRIRIGHSQATRG